MIRREPRVCLLIFPRRQKRKGRLKAYPTIDSERSMSPSGGQDPWHIHGICLALPCLELTPSAGSRWSRCLRPPRTRPAPDSSSTAAARQSQQLSRPDTAAGRLSLGGFQRDRIAAASAATNLGSTLSTKAKGGAHSQSASRSAGRAALAHLCSSTPCRWMGPKPVPIPGAAQRSPARAFPYPQFRDKNRRDIGKSQPKWTASKMEAAWFATAAGAAAGGAAAAVEAGCCQACGTCTRTRVRPHAHTPHVRLSHSHEMLVPPPRRRRPEN
jgi:hypothetical protein